MDFNGLLILCLSLCFFVLCVTVFVTLRIKKKRNLSQETGTLKPVYAFIAGFFLSAATLFFPLYYNSVFFKEAAGVNAFKSVVLSLHNTVRLFVVDDDFQFVQGILGAGELGVNEVLRVVYTSVFVVYYVVAPLLTATFILSLVSDFNQSVKYFFLRRRNVYVFSVLSASSLAVARDAVKIKENGKNALIIFADIEDLNDTDEGEELKTAAKRLGAIFFKGDVTSVKLYRGNGNLRKIYFISENEQTNLVQALDFIERAREDSRVNNARTQLFVFARSDESEVLLNSADKGRLKVRRINRKRNMIWDTLRTHSVFDDAYDDNGVKVMNIAIAGFGSYSLELVKALCWMGQMPGYKLVIHVFDKERRCKTTIEGECPEIIKYNGVRMEGCPYYEIHFHDSVDVLGGEFNEKLKAAGRITTFFATLGTDELNIECAMRARRILGVAAQENGWDVPPIFAVVYSDVLNDTVEKYGLKSFNGNSYGITLIGDVKTRFSIEVIEQKPLEKLAYKCHRAWGKNKENLDKFKKYEYFRRASLAQALHARFAQEAAKKLGVSDESYNFGDAEHKRWMAYMRTEGYVYGKVKDDVAKTHPSLVPTKELSEAEFEKDFIVIRSRKQ